MYNKQHCNKQNIFIFYNYEGKVLNLLVRESEVPALKSKNVYGLSHCWALMRNMQYQHSLLRVNERNTLHYEVYMQKLRRMFHAPHYVEWSIVNVSKSKINLCNKVLL